MDSRSIEPNVFDVNRLSALKRQVKDNDPAALKEAARQFEALFLQMVLKSMREAMPKDGLFDSDQSRMYESLLDQQWAQALATKGGGTGLAAMLEKQLQQPAAVEPRSFPGGLPLSPAPRAFPVNPAPLPLPPGPSAGSEPAGVSVASDFVDRIAPHAELAARAIGIPARFLVAHAALESGWGRAEPRRADGSRSYNLFGIKAGRSWAGPVAEAETTEYVGGVAQRQVERFRAYASYAEAFSDYATLIGSNPRYAGVVGSQSGTTFARGLQRAGYATDPDYAAKLERIIAGPALASRLTA